MLIEQKTEKLTMQSFIQNYTISFCEKNNYNLAFNTW